MERLLVSGFLGLGDTFYRRPIVQALVDEHMDKQVTLATAYPEFYHDIDGLDFWYRPTILRCAEAAMMRVPKHMWAPVHKRTPPQLGLSYNHKHFSLGLNIIQGFEESVRLPPGPVTLKLEPKFEWQTAARKVIKGRKVLIVRKPTNRAEWNCAARNPAPGLMQKLIDHAHTRGFTTISIGNNKKHEEELAEPLRCNEEYEKGELDETTIFGLFCEADACLTGQGYAIPMSLAAGSPCFTVYGGYVGPELLYDDRMDYDNHRWVAPEPFCGCLKMDHNCRKKIDHDLALDAFRDFLGSCVGRRGGDGVLPRGRVPGSAGTAGPVRRGVLREVRGVRDDGSGSGSDGASVEDGPEALEGSSN